MRQRLPLRTVLIASFVVQILGAVGSIAYLSFQNGERAVSSLAEKLMDEQSDRVVEYLRNYTATPPLVTQLNVNALKNKELDGDNLQAWGDHLFSQSQLFNVLGYIYYGKTNGEYVEFRKFKDNQFKYGVREGSETPSVQVYRMTEGRSKELLSVRSYDPRTRPWYQMAVSTGKAGWTGVYKFTDDPPTLGISFVRPWYDGSALQGVMGTDFVLLEVNQFLKQLKVGQSGKVFIIDRTGSLVAAATEQAPFDGDRRLRASELNDPLIRSTAEQLQQQSSSYLQTRSRQHFTVQAAGQSQFVQLTSFGDRYGLDWRVVIVVPKSDFMGEIDRNTQQTIWLCLGALGVAIGSSIVTARWLARPILDLSRASEKIAGGELVQSVKVRGGREIGVLATVFNDMSVEVQQSRQKLEEYARSLEQIVQQRTQDLAQANRELQQKNRDLSNTLDQLTTTQLKLIESEKLAALGQLVAGVAHEMNTPLGAICASVENMAEFFDRDFNLLPQFLQGLPIDRRQDFFALLNRSSESIDVVSRLSSRERRQFKRALIDQLTQHQIENADSVADTLVDMGICDRVEPFVTLLRDRNRDSILKVAYQLSTLQRSVRTISVASDQASKVVLALKTYAHPNQKGAWTQVDVIRSIETALTIYQNQIKRGIEVVRDYHDVPMIRGCADELNQVWMNLIHNALQAIESKTEETTGILTIAVTREESKINIKVTDTGMGIAPEARSEIFKPFFTTKPLGEGTGLGLNIAKTIVEKHGGTIDFESRSGWTQFVVVLESIYASRS